MILHFVERNEAERNRPDSVTRSVMISEQTTTPGNAVENSPVVSQTHPLASLTSSPGYITSH